MSIKGTRGDYKVFSKSCNFLDLHKDDFLSFNMSNAIDCESVNIQIGIPCLILNLDDYSKITWDKRNYAQIRLAKNQKDKGIWNR